MQRNIHGWTYFLTESPKLCTRSRFGTLDWKISISTRLMTAWIDPVLFCFVFVFLWYVRRRRCSCLFDWLCTTVPECLSVCLFVWLCILFASVCVCVHICVGVAGELWALVYSPLEECAERRSYTKRPIVLDNKMFPMGERATSPHCISRVCTWARIHESRMWGRITRWRG